MVNAPGSSTGYQPIGTQPAIVTGPDTQTRKETVQPRQAPAADAQRGDQKPPKSRNETTEAPRTEVRGSDAGVRRDGMDVTV